MNIGYCISTPFKMRHQQQQPFIVIIENIGVIDHALSHPSMVHQADSTTVSSLSMGQAKRRKNQEHVVTMLETKPTTTTWW
mmetsp:Transcript_4692/g.7194  ORF Transcript_4692/g.7194 Transcript_4692/m.7194 type:complete len:81 (-) Transcript_4692:230-472(-)|eukprot:CAMPEP_0118703888 /NCGR_PEP_ID=MMETSP0800-20121206/18865_1 /TAXON_ID=210618 ORGANISM="Striatella unipunctata, Strain CCMP2910" /NCGR_SAMPLE_ID=MMETSP0800 /ASSEMBLY_ACC=CAM_ASM_000638 /LENGTH=80 /DNA_ID=CAMNT_0006605587 /DNA_START=41 /DNA_END=283 /DNA_ORIENTATION=-